MEIPPEININRLPEITSRYDKFSGQELVDVIIEAPKYQKSKEREKLGINKYLLHRILEDFPAIRDSRLFDAIKSIDPIIVYQLLVYANHGPITYKKVFAAVLSKQFTEKATKAEILEILRLYQEPEMLITLAQYYDRLDQLGILNKYIDAQLYSAITKDYVNLLKAATEYYRLGNRNRANEIIAKITNAAIINGYIGKIMNILFP